MRPGVVAALALALARAAPAVAASLTSLSSEAPELLKEALFGGACWAVACTDVHDQRAGRDLLERALDDRTASAACRGAQLRCGARLPSGKTALQRLGLMRHGQLNYQITDVNGHQALA